MSSEELPGATIDVGVNPLPRRTILPTWVKAAVCLAVVLSCAAMLLAALLFAANRQVANEDRERERARTDQAIYAIGYRLCARVNVNRAYLRERDPAASKLEILDCSPNLRGLPATILPPGQTREFMDDFEAGRLSQSEQGICRDGIPLGAPNVC